MKRLLSILALVAVTMADDTSVEGLLNVGNNQFTARMFSEVVKSQPDKSVVMSAFSVLSPLAQLGLASVGPSHDELLKAIGFPNDEKTKEVFALVNKKLRSVKGVVLKMANRVYIPEGNELNDNFAAVSRDVFSSEVKNVDFTKSQETANTINTWVENQTNNRIKDLVDPNSLTPNTKAVLVNAIYFKGTWLDKFDPAETSDRDFHVNKQKTIKLPTMHRHGNYKYAESSKLNAKLLELPYDGEQSSLIVILPNDIDGLAALEEKLKDPTVLTKETDNMYEYEVDVFLPKFKIETTTNLKEVLEKMSVKKLFSSGEAKLDNLVKNASDLYVSDAIQKAFIEVNEEGAEAAAANEFIIFPGAASPQRLHSFKVDKPFYFALRADTINVVTAFVGLGASPFAKPPPKLFQVDRPFYFEIVVDRSTRIFNGVVMSMTKTCGC